MRAFDAVCTRPWAITEEALQTILEIAARENLSPEAVAAQLGRPLENSHAVTIQDGVATIPVQGPIFRRANMFTEVSGATSIETLARDFRQALDDPSVRGIVFDIDSPGGEVAGVHEFADMIYAARGAKPMIAYIDDYGASAAYWIASAADTVIASATAKVGSIGVVSAVRDPTTRSARAIEFVSSQSPKKRLDPTTPDGKTQIQTIVDDLAGVFVDSVARNRSVSTGTVLADFGQGGIFIGQGAVTAGLADRLGSHEQALAEARVYPRAGPVPAAAHDHSPPTITGSSAPRHAPPTGGTTSRRGRSMSILENLNPWYKAGRDARDLARNSGADVPDESAFDLIGSAAEEARKVAHAEEVASLKAERDAVAKERDAAQRERFVAMSQRLEAEATGYVDGLITGNLALPRERESLIGTYRQAAMDDAQHGLVADVDGAQVSRIERFKALCAVRAPLTLTAEGIRVSDGGEIVAGNRETDGGGEVLKPEEKAKLLALTPAGREALAKMHGAK